MNDKSTISINLFNRIASVITSIFLNAVFILCCINGEGDWWITVGLAVYSLTSIVSLVASFIMDHYMTLDYEGFNIIKHNRLNSKIKIESYKWKDIKNMNIHISHLGRPHNKYLHISYKNYSYEDVDFNGYAAYEKKFIKLAQYYSGRQGIVKGQKKRKLYEKDW